MNSIKKLPIELIKLREQRAHDLDRVELKPNNPDLQGPSYTEPGFQFFPKDDVLQMLFLAPEELDFLRETNQKFPFFNLVRTI